MGKLFNKLKKLTTPNISDRGVTYFFNRNVELTTFIKTEDKVTIESRVKGNYKNSYNVGITYFEGDGQEESVIYECSCPNFEDTGKPCKHIIATGMATDKEIEIGNIYFKENREFKRKEDNEEIAEFIRITEDDEYDDLFKETKIKAIYLPSPSAANASLKLNDLIKAYSVIKNIK